jgi:hypothetical protein
MVGTRRPSTPDRHLRLWRISTPYRYHIIAAFEVKLRPSSAYGAFGPYVVNITCCAVWLGLSPKAPPTWYASLSVDAAIDKWDIRRGVVMGSCKAWVSAQPTSKSCRPGLLPGITNPDRLYDKAGLRQFLKITWQRSIRSTSRPGESFLAGLFSLLLVLFSFIRK